MRCYASEYVATGNNFLTSCHKCFGGKQHAHMQQDQHIVDMPTYSAKRDGIGSHPSHAVVAGGLNANILPSYISVRHVQLMGVGGSRYVCY